MFNLGFCIDIKIFKWYNNKQLNKNYEDVSVAYIFHIRKVGHRLRANYVQNIL